MGLIEDLRVKVESGQRYYAVERERWCGGRTRVVVVSPLEQDHSNCQHGHHHHRYDAPAYAEGVVHAVLSKMTPNVDPKKPHTLALATSDAIIMFAEGPIHLDSGPPPAALVHLFHYDAVRTMRDRRRRVVLRAIDTDDLESVSRRRNDPLFGADLMQMRNQVVEVRNLFEDHWRKLEDGEDQVVGDEGQPAGDDGGDGGEGVDVHPPDGGEDSPGGGPDGPAPE